MKTISDSERASATMDPRHNLKRIRDTKAAVSSQLESLEQSIKENEEKLVLAEADQIYRDSTDDERSETLRSTLTSQREQIRTLESKLKALDLAEKQAGDDVRQADRDARAQAAQRLLNDYKSTIGKLQGVLEDAETLNDHLVELDAQYQKSDLAQVGGKTLILLLRSGAAWTALTPPPIHGSPLHISDWRKYIKGVLGDL